MKVLAKSIASGKHSNSEFENRKQALFGNKNKNPVCSERLKAKAIKIFYLIMFGAFCKEGREIVFLFSFCYHLNGFIKQTKNT